MKRPLTPISVGAMVLALVTFVYAFSFPIVVDFALRYLPRSSIPHILAFYRPVGEIAVRCPPYAAILKWEARLLGIPFQLGVPPPGFS
jgi:hypothetical protein